MVRWETELGINRQWRPRKGVPQSSAADQNRMDSRWQSWRTRLQTELTLATGVYAIAHLLFGLSWSATGRLSFTASWAVVPILFLIGTVLLGKVMRTLEDPVVACHPAKARQAGFCLAVTATLALSPTLWWLALSR